MRRLIKKVKFSNAIGMWITIVLIISAIIALPAINVEASSIPPQGPQYPKSCKLHKQLSSQLEEAEYDKTSSFPKRLVEIDTQIKDIVNEIKNMDLDQTTEEKLKGLETSRWLLESEKWKKSSIDKIIEFMNGEKILTRFACNVNETCMKCMKKAKEFDNGFYELTNLRIKKFIVEFTINEFKAITEMMNQEAIAYTVGNFGISHIGMPILWNAIGGLNVEITEYEKQLENTNKKIDAKKKQLETIWKQLEECEKKNCQPVATVIPDTDNTRTGSDQIIAKEFTEQQQSPSTEFTEEQQPIIEEE